MPFRRLTSFLFGRLAADNLDSLDDSSFSEPAFKSARPARILDVFDLSGDWVVLTDRRDVGFIRPWVDAIFLMEVGNSKFFPLLRDVCDDGLNRDVCDDATQ